MELKCYKSIHFQRKSFVKLIFFLFYFHRKLPANVYDYKRDLFRGSAESARNPLAYLKLLTEINQRDYEYVNAKPLKNAEPNSKPKPVPERFLRIILFFEDKFDFLEILDINFQLEVANEKKTFYQNHGDEIRKCKEM